MFDDFSVVGVIEVLDVLFVLVEEENVLGQPLNDGQHVHGKAEFTAAGGIFKLRRCFVEQRIL